MRDDDDDDDDSSEGESEECRSLLTISRICRRISK